MRRAFRLRGSRSTPSACEQTGRRCYMMEIDALYPSTSLPSGLSLRLSLRVEDTAVSLSNRCDVIVQRWEQFTGGKTERITEEQEAPEE